MATQTFTSSGTWTAPFGVATVQAECWGPGGQTSGIVKVAGGGGGAYAKTNSVIVTPGKTYTVTVGTPGNSSSFNGESGSCVAHYGNSNTGGLVASCTGDVKIAGGNGGNGVTYALGGGGGGCAGAAGQSVSPYNGGAGGYSGGSGGNGGTYNDPKTSVCNGANGVAPGGGGGGAGGDYFSYGDTGVGANGQVILTWTVINNILLNSCTSP